MDVITYGYNPCRVITYMCSNLSKVVSELEFERPRFRGGGVHKGASRSALVATSSCHEHPEVPNANDLQRN